MELAAQSKTDAVFTACWLQASFSTNQPKIPQNPPNTISPPPNDVKLQTVHLGSLQNVRGKSRQLKIPGISTTHHF